MMETLMQKRWQAIVVYSPYAGRAAELPQALSFLKWAGVDILQVIPIATLDPLAAQGRAWQERGVDLVVAAGGDGVVGGVLSHIATCGLPLGILPLGTANDIARSLRLPQDLQAAALVIAHGTVRPVDIGVAHPAQPVPLSAHPTPHGSVFVPVSSHRTAFFAHALTIGLNVQFARVATNVATRQRYGYLTYPVAALEVARTYEAVEVELCFEGLALPTGTGHPSPQRICPRLTCRALQVTVINAPLFGGRWQLAVPHASLSDGLLDIVVIEDLAVLGTIQTLLARLLRPEAHAARAGVAQQEFLFTHHPTEVTGLQGVHHVQVRGVTMRTQTDPVDVTLDGELRGRTPLWVHVADEQLHVVMAEEMQL